MDPSEVPYVVVVALDRSSQAPAVLEAAVRLTRTAPASVLHIAHAVPTGLFDHSSGGSALLEEARAELAAHVRTAAEHSQAKILDHILVGDPTREIVALAERVDADAIVVGSQDLTAFERLVLGSVAEGVLRKAHCMVFVVRAKRHAEAVR